MGEQTEVATKRTSAYGHAIRPMTPDELALAERMGWHCSRPRCRIAARFVVGATAVMVVMWAHDLEAALAALP